MSRSDTVESKSCHKQRKLKKKRPIKTQSYTDSVSSDDDSFSRSNSEESDECGSDKENKPIFSKALIKSIKDNRKGAIVDSSRVRNIISR